MPVPLGIGGPRELGQRQAWVAGRPPLWLLLTARLLFLLPVPSEKRHLQVNVTNPVQCSLNGKKCTVSVETRLNQPQPDFTKSRSGFTLSVPGN